MIDGKTEGLRRTSGIFSACDDAASVVTDRRTRGTKVLRPRGTTRPARTTLENMAERRGQYERLQKKREGQFVIRGC